MARLKKVVDDLKDEHGNVIFVNGGDFYQGTIWYTKFKWKVVSKFANLLNFTAMVWTINRLWQYTFGQKPTYYKEFFFFKKCKYLTFKVNLYFKNYLNCPIFLSLKGVCFTVSILFLSISLFNFW